VRRARTGRTAAARLHCTFQRNPRTALLEKAATRRVGRRPWPLPAIPSRFRRGRGCRIRWLVLRKNAETGCGAVARPLVLHVVFSLRSMETQNKVLG
jgi:hypothetical protein